MSRLVRLAGSVSITLFVVACGSDDTSSGTTAGTGAAGSGASGSSGGPSGSGASSSGAAGTGGGSSSGGAGGNAVVLESTHFNGRFDLSDAAGPRSAWSGTSIGARFSGTSIDADLDGDNYFQVVVDGMPTDVLHTSGGMQTYTLATGLPDGMHDIEIFRRAEAFQGVVQFGGFKPGGGGMLVDSPSPYLHNIEFIGDSITCGYGDEDMQPCQFTTATESAYITYAAIAARNTKAAAHIIAWSGKGAAKNCCGDGSELMPELYERTLPQDAGSQWDFSSWIADAVVINLGTNDWNSSVDPTAFEDAYKALIQEIRSHYAGAAIYCVGGDFLGGTATTHIENVITSLGDPKVKLLDLPGPDAADGFGCDYHPSAATHAKLGEVLTGVLKQDLGW